MMAGDDTKKWDKTLLAVLLQWDYGDRARGESGEKSCFYGNLKKLVRNVEVFWYDEYLKDRPGLQKALVAKADDLKPDLLFFIPYTDQFSFKTLDYLKSRYATYAWFGDDTWRYESFSSGLAPHFTQVSTTDPWSVAKYNRIGIKPIVTQWAGQPRSASPGPIPPEKYEHEVTFVGAYNEVRGWFIDRLKKNGIEVACFGFGWPRGKISIEGMEEVFRKSRINLNLSNSVPHDVRYVFGGIKNIARYLVSQKTAEQIKARNFEIPMAGGFQLSKYVLGLERYFEIGREIAVYNSPEECAEQVGYFLEHEAERLEITRRGQDRAKKEHTYLRRLEYILGTLFA